jgi:micrococcal nuclease
MERAMVRKVIALAAAIGFVVVTGCKSNSLTSSPLAAPTSHSAVSSTPAATAPAVAPTASAAPALRAAPNGALTRPSDALGPYRISSVVDGDTDHVSINGRTVKLRLIGIDTPETKDPRKRVQCFGEQASTRAHQLLDGKSVWIEYDASQDHRDRYGRDLVYVWLDGHTMFNEVMVAEGYAHEYTYDLPYRYQQQFRAAQSKASAAGLGFWNQQTCSGDTEQAAGAATGGKALAPTTAPTPVLSDGVVYYSSCAKVRAAGKAPLMKGEPGYRSALDADHNGVACQ